MDYLQLAYLAEFSAAYNLAFGEFKHDKQAEVLKSQFDELKNYCSGLISKEQKESTPTTKSKSKDMKQVVDTDYGKSIYRLLEFIESIQKADKKDLEYDPKFKPIKGFFNRSQIFCWRPGSSPLQDEKNILINGFNWLRLQLIALLPSWGFSKTALWTYKPCKSSLWGWSIFVIAIAFLVGLVNIASVTPYIPRFHNIYYSIFGALFLLFGLRPLCHIVSHMLNAPRRTRAKDYPKALFFIATLTVLFITIKGHDTVETTNEHYWWFILGMLFLSIMYPLMLSFAYELIDARMKDIVKIINDDGDDTVKGKVDSKLASISIM